MTREIRSVRQAKADVNDTISYIAPRSMRGAIAWYLAFRRALDRIADAPGSHALAAESDDIGRELREVLFRTRSGRKYRIIYEVFDTEILILRIRRPGEKPLRRRDVLED